MRFAIEVAYKGTSFSGFQIQKNGITIQGELEKALHVLTQKSIELVGSSRTDAGVHARQNYFHCDTEAPFSPKIAYQLNAIISPDIVVKNIRQIPDEAHVRFDATSRSYRYNIYQEKDPFQREFGYYYPFPLSLELLQETAATILGKHDFTSFSKRNTQVFTFNCEILKSEWHLSDNGLYFLVEGNRFLRGMVRGLVATMLKVGRGTISIADFSDILACKDCTKADFSAPGKGLFLQKVNLPY